MPKEDELLTREDQYKSFDVEESESLFKAASDDKPEGYIKAVFATLDVTDKHGDVLLPGSVGKQFTDFYPWNHGLKFGFMGPTQSGTEPIGQGKVYEEGNKAIFEGHLYMDIQKAADTYKLLKHRKRKQQYSMHLRNIKYIRGNRDGKDVYLIKKFRVGEVSPVGVGAGIGTRTLSLKSLEESGVEVTSEIKELFDFRDKYKALSTENETMKEDLRVVKNQIQLLIETQSDFFDNLNSR